MGRQLTKKEVHKIGHEFGLALSTEFSHHGSQPHLTEIARVRRLQADYCRRLSSRPELARELKRRVAEVLLQMTMNRPCKMPACRARFKKLSKLGFTDVETKGHFHLLYAREALKRGHRILARKTASKMAKELHGALAIENSLLGRQILGHLQTLIRKV